MTSRPYAEIDPVLRAAMALVAADGLKGLSLRPLAEALGTTVSALSHRFGLKDELVAALIEAACAEDCAFLDDWLARIHALAPVDGVLLAELADAIFDDMVGPHGQRTLFYCELAQGAPSRPEIAVPFAAWRARRLAFWQAAAAALMRPDLAEALDAYSIDETAHGLAIGNLAAYRWLRRLCLRRLCCGLAPAPDGSDQRQFAVFHAALGNLTDGPGRYPAPGMNEWQANAARHVSALIIAHGADAVTHRAVAGRAGIASSTLAYHFPRQEDLLKAGLNDIIMRTHGMIDAPSPQADDGGFALSSVEIARATFAVALAATRMPDLRAFAADMRRRRGENYIVHLNRHAPAGMEYDIVAAQALAMTGIGRLILDGVVDPAGGDAAFALVAQLRESGFR
jgi:AcrR family transcriptional regulator